MSASPKWRGAINQYINQQQPQRRVYQPTRTSDPFSASQEHPEYRWNKTPNHTGDPRLEK